MVIDMKFCLKRNLGFVSLAVLGSLLCVSQAHAMDGEEKYGQYVLQIGSPTPQQTLDLAEKGSTQAQNNLGVRAGEQGNHAQAFLYLKRAADAGEPMALYNLGHKYFHGKGLPQDYKKAISYYERAAEKGYEVAMSDLGVIYYRGTGVQPDAIKALGYFQNAASRGLAAAYHNMALLYEDYGDEAQALSCFEKAAGLGHIPSQYELGAKYLNGDGVPQDDEKAFSSFQQVEKQGNRDKYYAAACYYLARMYQQGRGVPFKDRQKSLLYYACAVRAGDSEAEKVIASFEYEIVGHSLQK